MKKNNRVAVILLNWNGGPDTIRCLASLTKSTYPSVTPIVVDNDSKDTSVADITKEYPDVLVLQSGNNLGYAGGNNVGIRHALEQGFDFIFVVNNDTTIEPDCILKLVNTLESDPTIGQVGPLIIDQPAKTIGNVGGTINVPLAEPRQIGHMENDRTRYTTTQSVDFVPGTAVMMPAKAIKEAGLLPDSYFLYFEDVVWSLQFQKKGFKTVVNPLAVVNHWESSSTGAGSPIKWYFMTRNNLLCFNDLVPAKMRRSVAIRLHIKFVKQGLRLASTGNWRALRALWLGLRDGHRHVTGKQKHTL